MRHNDTKMYRHLYFRMHKEYEQCGISFGFIKAFYKHNTVFELLGFLHKHAKETSEILAKCPGDILDSEIIVVFNKFDYVGDHPKSEVAYSKFKNIKKRR